MTQRCGNCGTELFTGQQFCRLCGTPTRAFTSGEIPTQILPAAAAPPRAGQTNEQPAETTPLPARDTADPVYPSRYAGQTTPPHATARGEARRSRRGLVFGLLAAVVVSVGASAYIARRITLHWVGKRAAQEKQIKIVVPKAGRPETPPPMPPVPAVAELEDDGEDEPLDEDDAEVTAGETVITKSFAVEAGGLFALTNVAGDIRVEGWDGEEAEVKITKRGGTPDEREAVEIMHRSSPGRTQLTTGKGGARGVREVRYEIKLPRGLRQVDIVSTDSNVSVSGLDAGVGVVVMRGEIELDGVAGTVSTRTTKGHTKVALASADPAAPMMLNGVNGNVEIRLRPGTNAEFKAETIDGRVEAGGGVRLNVERRLSGEHAVGRLGKGGQPIVAKTVSGNIKIGS